LRTVGRIFNRSRVSLPLQHNTEREMSASACTRSLSFVLSTECENASKRIHHCRRRPRVSRSVACCRLDNYRATLQKKRQQDQDAEESTEQDLSSDVHDASPAAGDGVVEHNDESPRTSTTAAAAAAAAVPAESQKQAYVDWETMQEM